MNPTICLSKLLTVFVILMPQSISTFIIQAEIDLNDDSEHLIKNLIKKVDAIIDPHIDDTANATIELAYALLKIGPLLSVKGNISDRLNTFSFSFNLDAKAGVLKSLEMNAVSLINENEDCHREEQEEGYLETFVITLENYMIVILNLIGHALMTNVIANLMSDLALHSDTNLIC